MSASALMMCSANRVEFYSDMHGTRATCETRSHQDGRIGSNQGERPW